MRVVASAVGIVLLLVVPAAAGAQNAAPSDYFGHIAQSKMQRLTAPWLARGFEPIGELRIGVLAQRDRDSLAVQLEQGRQYAALGVCDEDCGDIDLHLFDATEKEIAFEAAANSRSLLRVTSADGGAYRLEVVMMQCSTPPCYYAVQLLRGRETSRPSR